MPLFSLPDIQNLAPDLPWFSLAAENGSDKCGLSLGLLTKQPVSSMQLFVPSARHLTGRFSTALLSAAGGVDGCLSLFPFLFLARGEFSSEDEPLPP